MKRAIDILVSGLALLLLWPVILITAGLVRVSMGSPVLFCQQRPGLGGRPFTLVKFRTMRDATDPAGRPLPDAQRLTRVGRLLRRTSLDELPQLWNVLKGDMSLVGPRPLLMEYLPRYNARQRRRHDVRPGITGWAQVNGRNALSWEEKFEHDVWYVEHRSLGLDVKIVLMTLGQVFAGRGVSAGGHATMPEFMGTASGEDHGDPGNA
jgi:lipopolysaccharide/colanic/teichoic acid biosynthesis glycosyltransferase